MNRLTKRSTGEPARRPAGWLAGLDGLRALAVIAVMLFHFAPDVLPGGFLGVDLFFTISGFLITRLLLLEVLRTGRLDLIGFYRRRWRRLMPAVATLLGVVILACLTVWRDELATLRSAILASAGFATNWWLIFDHQSYFVASGRPPMVQHLWSLAIEEQFYLVWPLLLAALVGLTVLGRGGRLTTRSLLRVAVVSTVLGVGSAVAMAVLSIRADIPYGADSGRVYFGTDTHSSGLLFGAALGALSIWPILEPSRRWVSARRARASVLGTDVVAVIALALLVRQAFHVNYYDPALFRGGFAVIAVLGAVLVATVSRPGSLIGRALDLPVLRWIGQRSYALYLWHWPVAVVTRPDVDISGPHWLLIVNQFVITVVLAAASYRFIEQPFRAGTVADWLGGRSRRRTGATVARTGFSPWRHGAAWLLGAACLAAMVGAAETGQHVANAQGALGAMAYPTSGRTAIDTIGTPSALPPVPSPVNPSASPTGVGSKAKALLRPSATVSAFGDSVMLGAATNLISDIPGIQVSAVEGRQARTIFADIAIRRAQHTLAPIVVIHTGDNGIVSPDDLNSTLISLRDRQRVVLVTARVPRDWQGPNDATIEKAAKKFTNVVVVDWYAKSNGQASWFYGDGLHLRPDGAAAYAALIRTAVRSR
jgi:peptidoglycan/LPS O-acetylase OafA/YrhL